MDGIKTSKPSKISDINVPKVETVKMFGHNNLPSTMHITKWGHCKFSHKYTKCEVTKVYFKSRYHFSIILREDRLEITVSSNDKIMFTFTDVMNDVYNLSTFTRYIY